MSPLRWLFLLFLPATAAAQSSSCETAVNAASGCAFRAVSLPNPFLDQTQFAFSIEVLNPLATSTTVTVTGGALGAPIVQSVAPQSTVAIPLPWVSALSTANATVKVADAAYRITASQPVVAMQWNSRTPLNGANASGLNDGSLLRPENTGGRAFRVVTWPTQNIGGGQYPGYVAITAMSDATTVTVAAPSVILPGAGLSATGGTTTLDAGDVLLVTSALDAAATTGSDLSGALVTSDKPVLAFVGHGVANVPAGAPYADHVEESLPPLELLGSDHVVVRPPAPPGSGTPARHVVKIVASAPATIDYAPPVIGAPLGLAAGQTVTLEATTDFRMTSTAPLVVASFLEGSTQFGGTASQGDPSMSIVIPTAQAQSRIDFVAPAVHAPATALVVAPSAASIQLDGAPVSGWTAIGATGFSFAHAPIVGGSDRHTATGSRPFTLTVNAYPTGASTSYSYPAGFELPDAVFTNGFEDP